MDERIPVEIQPLLEAYRQQMAQHLPGWLEAFYLLGSIALGAFDPERSDIDFLAIVSRPAGKAETDLLRGIHAELGQRWPRWPLEGSYLRWQDLGRDRNEIPPYPCHHDRKLVPQGHHDINPVTWWMLQKKGVAVTGASPDVLPFAVDWEQLIAWMHTNLNTYWASWARRPGRLASLLTDAGIEWLVLGVLRQFYTFREHEIVSKAQAGRYALAHLDARWQRIIGEALSIREGKRARSYGSRLARAREAVCLLQEVIRSCNGQSGPPANFRGRDMP